jgi:transcriptional regulator with XRE-family HTH domain
VITRPQTRGAAPRASLAGVSIAYYTKLERGDTSGVSDTVLEALARAL